MIVTKPNPRATHHHGSRPNRLEGAGRRTRRRTGNGGFGPTLILGHRHHDAVERLHGEPGVVPQLQNTQGLTAQGTRYQLVGRAGMCHGRKRRYVTGRR